MTGPAILAAVLVVLLVLAIRRAAWRPSPLLDFPEVPS